MSAKDFDGKTLDDRIVEIARETFDENAEDAPCPSIEWEQALEAMRKAYELGRKEASSE